MKKEYKKPVIVVESFTLAEHIASNCRVQSGTSSGKPNYRNNQECAYINGNLYLFYSSENECDMDLFDDPNAPDISQLDVECYNVFASASTLFAS